MVVKLYRFGLLACAVSRWRLRFLTDRRRRFMKRPAFAVPALVIARLKSAASFAACETTNWATNW
jgi:hypothetical protein